jgi:hypothetical protein
MHSVYLLVNVFMQSVECDSILCNAVRSARQMMRDDTIHRVRVWTIVDRVTKDVDSTVYNCPFNLG